MATIAHTQEFLSRETNGILSSGSHMEVGCFPCAGPVQFGRNMHGWLGYI